MSVLFEKNRKRRVLYNDDAYQQTDQRVSLRTRLPSGRRWYDITDEQSFLDARTTPTFDTSVDTYVWCVGNGCEPPWGPWGLKHRGPVWPTLGTSQRATDIIVNAATYRPYSAQAPEMPLAPLRNFSKQLLG